MHRHVGQKNRRSCQRCPVLKMMVRSQFPPSQLFTVAAALTVAVVLSVAARRLVFGNRRSSSARILLTPAPLLTPPAWPPVSATLTSSLAPKPTTATSPAAGRETRPPGRRQRHPSWPSTVPTGPHNRRKIFGGHWSLCQHVSRPLFFTWLLHICSPIGDSERYANRHRRRTPCFPHFQVNFFCSLHY